MNHKFACVVVLHTTGEVVSDEKAGTSILNRKVEVYPIVTLIHSPKDALTDEDQQALKALIAKQVVDWASQSTKVTHSDGTAIERVPIPSDKPGPGEVN